MQGRTWLELLDVGEPLFARHGIEGVSLRQIAQEAGKANTNVVQYHFQSKESPIRQLLRWRVLSMEAPRAEMLARAKASGREHHVGTLLEIMGLPLLDAVDREGNRSTLLPPQLLDMLGREKNEHLRAPLTRTRPRNGSTLGNSLEFRAADEVLPLLSLPLQA